MYLLIIIDFLKYYGPYYIKIMVYYLEEYFGIDVHTKVIDLEF
jgi:hypothetical protein